MANGAFTHYQHMLLDAENLTKEDFVQFTDKWFYHFEQNGAKSVEELEEKRKAEIARYEAEIATQKNELAAIVNETEEERKEAYEAYVQNIKEFNERSQKTYDKQMERMQLIQAYVDAFRPHLNYIWENFTEPDLLLLNIEDEQEWLVTRRRSAERAVAFYEKLHAQLTARDNPESEPGAKVFDYEARKARFLAE